MLTTFDRLRLTRAIPEELRPKAVIDLATADAQLKGLLGWNPEAVAATTERVSGNGTPLLKLSRQYITAVTSLTVDGVAWTVLTQAGTDTGQRAFLPADGRWLEARYPDVWTKGSGNIKVVYASGYATVPEDIQEACAFMALLLLNERTHIGVESKTIGAESVSRVVRDWREYPVIADVVERYGIWP